MCDLHTIINNNNNNNNNKIGKTTKIVLWYLDGGKIKSVFPLKGNGEFIDDSNEIDKATANFLSRGICGKNGLDQSGGTIFGYAAIDGFGWGLIVSQNMNQLYSKLNQKLTLIGLLSLFLYSDYIGFWGD